MKFASEFGVVCTSIDCQNERELLKLSKRISDLEGHLDVEKRKLQHVIESSNFGTWELNLHTGEITCNERCSEMIGYLPEKLHTITIDTWLQGIHPEDREKSKEALFRHLARETEHYDIETRMKHKDGHWFWIRNRGKVISWTDDGEPALMFSTIFDITDRKRSQKAHVESEKRFNLALESAEVGLCDWNILDNTTYFSPQWKKLLGYEEHELENVHDTWKSRWHPEDAAKIEQAMEDYLQGKTKNYNVAYRIRHKNGKWRWFLSQGVALKDVSGKPYRWVGTNIDITELIHEKEKNEELERFFHFTPDLMCISDKQGLLLKTNEAWSIVLGYPAESLVHRNFLDLLHPDDVKPTLGAIAQVVNQGEINSFINRYRCADGSNRYIEWFARAYGEMIYASGRDVTEKNKFDEIERHYQQELKERNTLIETILDNAPVGIWLTGEKGSSVFMNTYGNYHFNLTAEEVAICQSTDNDARSKDGPQHYEEVVTFKDGKKHIVETVKTRIMGEDGKVIGILSIGLDITKRKEDEETLRLNEEKLRLLTENMTDTLWVLNITQGRFTYVSPSVVQLLDFTPEEFLAKEISDIVMPDSLANFIEQIEEATQDLIMNTESPKVFANEIQECTKSGEPIWVEYSAKCRFNVQNEIEAVGISRNIEERKKAEQEILYLSQHDKLTGLFNRHYFDVKVAEEIARSNRYHCNLSFIILDIDHFKKVNDTWGHSVGDYALQQVAGIVKRMVRQNDTVARMGGEEFIILLPETTEEGARVVAKKIREAIEKKGHPVIGRLTASFGVAERKSSESYTNWFKRLDESLYHSKNTGRNRVTCADDLEKRQITEK